MLFRTAGLDRARFNTQWLHDIPLLFRELRYDVNGRKLCAHPGCTRQGQKKDGVIGVRFCRTHGRGYGVYVDDGVTALESGDGRKDERFVLSASAGNDGNLLFCPQNGSNSGVWSPTQAQGSHVQPGARHVIAGVQHVFKDVAKASFGNQTLDAKAALESPWIQNVHITFAEEGTILGGDRVARVTWEGPRSFLDQEEASRLCRLNLYRTNMPNEFKQESKPRRRKS